MEENRPQGDDQQGKEAKKVEAKFERAMRQLTALLGGPNWAKANKIEMSDIPEIMTRIVQNKKEELFKKFESNYVDLVEEKKRLDKTIVDKEKEFKKVVLEAKKDFLKKVDAALSIVGQIDRIEREYYQTIGVAVEEGQRAEQDGTEQQDTGEGPQNQ